MSDLGLFQDPQGNGYGPSRGRSGRREGRQNRKRQRRKAARGRAAVLFSLAFLVAVVGTGGVLGYAWLNSKLHPPDYTGSGEGSVVLQIRDGEIAGQYAPRMVAEHIVKSAAAFEKAARNNPQTSTIQPGYYQMRVHMSSAAALALLLDPKARAANQITIPEGKRAAEIVALLAQKTGIPVSKFQAAEKNPAALGLPAYANGKVEGFLWPSQYNLPPNATAPQLLKMMVAQFVSANQGLAADAKSVHLTAGQVVIMASLIQAEAGKPADEPKIARVLYNRMANGTPFQLDTTVLYALNKRTLAVSIKDTQVKSPYNTYLVKGLPAGAIDSPGSAAIDAVLHPAKGNWLWFVATDPTHKITKFTAKESQFVQFQKEFNAWLKAHPQ